MIIHTLNNTVAKGFNQMAPLARTLTVALDMSKAFDTINIHTLIRKLLQTNIPGTIIKIIANYIKGRKAYTTYRKHTSRQRQLKLAFHKVASFHPHYLTFTSQTYHHPVHRFRSWPTQTTSQSHPHTQALVQPRNTYNHTYIQFLPGHNTQSHTKSRQNNLHLFTPDPAEYTSNNNKQQSTTHGNAPKGSGFYLRPKTHIHHTNPQHLSTRTQTSTNHKNTHCNRMG